MRYTVLTFIFDNYEIVREILVKDLDADYLLITDDPNLKSNTWNIIYDKSLDGMTPFEKCFNVRYNVFKYAKTDICIVIDGSIHVKDSLRPIIDEFEKGQYDASFMVHPIRSNMFNEYDVWIGTRGYSHEQMQKFLDLMEVTNYDYTRKLGFFQSGFKIVRNNKFNRDFQNITLALLGYLGDETNKVDRLDQTVFSYVIGTYFRDVNIMYVGEQLIQSKYMQFYYHNGWKIADELNNTFIYDRPDIRMILGKAKVLKYFV